MSFIVYLFERQVHVFQNSEHSYLNTSEPYSLYFGAHAVSGVHVLHRSVPF